MQNRKIFTLIGLLLVCMALISNHAIGRLPVPIPHVLPIEIMPTKVGEWQQEGKDRPVDPEIQQKLPTAKILDRIYRNPSGQEIELMLVTADNRDDIHNPTNCFPSQGWQLTMQPSKQINGVPVKMMLAQQNTLKFRVLYWMSGYFPPPTPQNPFMRRLAGLRDRMVGPDEGRSLFVRLMTDNTSEGEQALTAFAFRIMPSIAAMESTVKAGLR